MGRIADADDTFVDDTSLVYVNKVDRILERLDDDEDRAVVLSWLRDDQVSSETFRWRMASFGIAVGGCTIRRWRQYQGLGLGRVWDV